CACAMDKIEVNTNTASKKSFLMAASVLIGVFLEVQGYHCKKICAGPDFCYWILKNSVMISHRFQANILAGKDSRMALVLCTGVDPSVVHPRQLILERAGHVVVSALDEASLIAACGQNKFEVAVVGQTVSAKIKRRIARL